MFITYTINETGLNEIADFLRANHKEGDRIAADVSFMAAWADEAEESLEGGNPAMIEILGFESKTGNPITFTVSDDGIDEEEIED